MSDDFGVDSFTETTSQSWFSRIGDSLVGVLVGIGLFLAAFPLLFWNEGRAVHTARALAEGRAAVITVDSAAPSPTNTDKLVYVSGPLSASDRLLPANAGTNALKLRRTVEIYQWEEEKSSTTEKEVGGSTKTTTTYKYNKVWSSTLNNSNNFKHPDGHRNPASKQFNNVDVVAKAPKLGGFPLSAGVVALLNDFEPVPSEVLDVVVQRDLRTPVSQHGEWAYVGDPNAPRIGDVRVRYSYVPLTTASVVARQGAQGMLGPYIASNGEEVLIADMGAVSADQLFKAEEDGNVFLTWVLRLVGFLCMLFGLMMMTRPLAVLASVLPFLESVLEVGGFILALPLALSLSLVTIAVAWIAYRPLIAIPLLVVALGALLWPVIRRRMGGARPAMAGPGGRRPPPMPPRR